MYHSTVWLSTIIRAFRQEYKNYRPHSSLGYLTPVEFARRYYKKNQVKDLKQPGDKAGSLSLQVVLRIGATQCGKHMKHELLHIPPNCSVPIQKMVTRCAYSCSPLLCQTKSHVDSFSSNLYPYPIAPCAGLNHIKLRSII